MFAEDVKRRLAQLNTQSQAVAAAAAHWPYPASPIYLYPTNTYLGTDLTRYGAQQVNIVGSSLTTLISVTGSGLLELAAVRATAGVSGGYFRLVVTIDGQVLSDTDGLLVDASVNRMAVIVGRCLGMMFNVAYTSGVGHLPMPVPFRSSLVIAGSKSSTLGSAALYYRHTLIDLT